MAPPGSASGSSSPRTPPDLIIRLSGYTSPPRPFVQESPSRKRKAPDPQSPAQRDVAEAATHWQPQLVRTPALNLDPGLRYYYHVIYEYLHAAEPKRPGPHYLRDVQKELNQAHREQMVKWIVNTCKTYPLGPDTLHRAVSLLDQFLSQTAIGVGESLHVALASVMIAMKFEDQHDEDIRFRLVPSDYGKSELVIMEKRMLESLGFRVSSPTVCTFLRIYLCAAQLGKKHNPLLDHLSHYLSEIACMDYAYTMTNPPFAIAASAVFLALWTLGSATSIWNRTLQNYSGFKAKDLRFVVPRLREIQLRYSTQGVINPTVKRYSEERFGYVSTLSSRELPASLFEEAGTQ